MAIGKFTISVLFSLNFRASADRVLILEKSGGKRISDG